MSKNVEQERADTTGSRRTVIVVAIVAVLAIAGIAALSTGGGNGSPGGGGTISETQPVTVSGVALPRYPEKGADPAVGQQAPTLSGFSFDGTPISITNDGKPKIIIFLTHWCPHCQNDVKELKPYIKANGLPDGVDFYAVSTASDPTAPNYPPSKWLADWPIPTMADDAQNSAAQAFGLNAFPFFVFVTAEGNVDFRFPGEVPPEALVEAAKQLATGR
ncbi:MAG: TlpA family protein disulfide reductase [Actinobacteria bacterium]|nr:TlpA family protein disulfide reductase [Actinomycetota bacterium]